MINTLITNLVMYPFYSAAVPILLKTASHTTWKTGVAFVNAGGILGPIISQLILTSRVWPRQELRAINTAITLQAVISLITLLALLISKYETMVAVFSLLHALATGATHSFTVTFNGFAARRLATLQRGRFLANLMTLANLSNAFGVFLYSGDVLTYASVGLGAAAASRFLIVWPRRILKPH